MILTISFWQINFHDKRIMMIVVEDPVTLNIMVLLRHLAQYININDNRLLLHTANHAIIMKIWVRLLLLHHVVNHVANHVSLLKRLLYQIVVRVKMFQMHVMYQAFRIQRQWKYHFYLSYLHFLAGKYFYFTVQEWHFIAERWTITNPRWFQFGLHTIWLPQQTIFF